MGTNGCMISKVLLNILSSTSSDINSETNLLDILQPHDKLQIGICFIQPTSQYLVNKWFEDKFI